MAIWDNVAGFFATFGMSPLEWCAVVITAFGVWLMARRHMACWPVGFVGVVLYFWIFFQSKLYSDMLLQVFFAASIVYGWLQWRRGTVPDGTVAVTAPSHQEFALSIVAGLIGSIGLGASMAHFTDAAAPWADSTLTSFSFVAQYWSARRFLVSWWLWITLDVFYIGLFCYKDLYPTALLYFIQMIICFYGLADWRRAARTA
jgi:nicotinamide mononucleotide transporter